MLIDEMNEMCEREGEGRRRRRAGNGVQQSRGTIHAVPCGNDWMRMCSRRRDCWHAVASINPCPLNRASYNIKLT